MTQRVVSIAVAFCVLASNAFAGDFVYQPVNPSFGGNPLNSSHLLQMAEIQNAFIDDDPFNDLFDEPSLADDFADAIRNGMVSIAAGELIDAIVQREDPDGTMELDGAIVTWNTIGDRVTIRVNDGTSVNVLDIPIPVTD